MGVVLRKVTKRVAKGIKTKVHMPKKVTPAFAKKVKKACKFCKENINIVKGNKKLIVIKSHKTLKAKKIHKKKAHKKGPHKKHHKKVHHKKAKKHIKVKKIHAMKKKKKVSHFKRLMIKVKRVHQRLIVRASTLVISIHTTIVTTMRRIKVSSAKVKIILQKKVKM